ncbi:MAG: hypothetical protein HY763_16785 [Planctomycetes bacterium]|nr:hypothetical protein [Planctomycetota bacterium]
MKYALALGESAKALWVFLWWITIAAASLGACFVGPRVIWVVLARVVESLGVPLHEPR